MYFVAQIRIVSRSHLAEYIVSLPNNGSAIFKRAAVKALCLLRGNLFPGSEAYWQERYEGGRTSGVGVYDEVDEFKAEIVNGFVKENRVASVIEFGCGDGNQRSLGEYPSYIGFDVSPRAVALCRERFRDDRSKRFELVSGYDEETAELTLPLDVIYHLVEDDVFESHMSRLFGASTRYVIVYSSNAENIVGHEATHVKHRKFTD